MLKVVGIGIQDFERIQKTNNFYIDKTRFIKEWWETNNEVTLITRPRRFGKTLTMSMLNCFFSNRYEGRKDLFEEFSIWREEKYQKLQGTYPVISITFAGIKPSNYNKFLEEMQKLVNELYLQFTFLQQSERLDSVEKERIAFLKNFKNLITESDLQHAISNLSFFLEKHFGKKVIILLDEYDTPMQEAYTYGYWEEVV